MGFSSSPSLPPRSVQQALLPASLSMVQDNTETYLICGVSGDHQVMPRNEPGIMIFSRELSSPVLLFFQPFLCRRKKNRVNIFLTGRTFLFCIFLFLKADWKESVSNPCQKPAFDMCQAYNISAPKTNLLESSYPPFLASQLQVTCRSRHFRTSLEGKQNVT